MPTRRNFTKNMAGLALGTTVLSALPLNPVYGRKPQNKKLGVALVGLGSYSTYQLAPALQQAEWCYLAGIVTGSPQKIPKWRNNYNIPEKNVYNYQNFDRIKENPDIDIVYVVLPNSMHAEFSIRAARAGKHVICEKPMAMNVTECDEIINACQSAGVKLSVGYRLQSEPYTRQVEKFVSEKTFGNVRFIRAEAGYVSRGNPNQWRLDKSLSGGGALMNMGVYSIQSIIYGSGEIPISVSAQEFSTRPEYFKDTDETITAQFLLPGGGVGQMMTSHNANANNLYASCDSGWFQLEPANNYGPLKGSSSVGPIEFPHESQQKLQMDDFARHILTGSPNYAPGEMGKRDMIIVEAIYESIRKGGQAIDLDIPQGYGM